MVSKDDQQRWSVKMMIVQLDGFLFSAAFLLRKLNLLERSRYLILSNSEFQALYHIGFGILNMMPNSMVTALMEK